MCGSRNCIGSVVDRLIAGPEKALKALGGAEILGRLIFTLKSHERNKIKILLRSCYICAIIKL